MGISSHSLLSFPCSRLRSRPDPKKSTDYSRVVNTAHTKRLARLLDDAGKYELVTGGVVDESEKYIAPTVLRKVQLDAKVMQDEISHIHTSHMCQCFVFSLTEDIYLGLYYLF